MKKYLLYTGGILLLFLYCFPLQAADSTTYYGTELIRNGGFSEGNTGFITDYMFSKYNLEPEGVYGVVRDPWIVFREFDRCSDHSGENGYMMVVNGADHNYKYMGEDSVPLIVWGQDVPVEKNNAYEFGFWYSTMHGKSPAEIDIFINGTLMTPSSVTFSPETCIWNYTSVIWYSGRGTTASVRIYNNNREAMGNDFALDDITMKPICTINADAGMDISYCKRESSVLKAEFSGGEPPYQYFWQPSEGLISPQETETLINTRESRFYYFIVRDGLGCVFVDSVFVEVFDEPSAEIKSDKGDMICPCDSITFYIDEEYICKWSNGETSKSITISEPGSYMLEIIDEHGCSSTFAKSFSYLSSEMNVSLDSKTAYPGERVTFPVILSGLSNITECGYKDFKGKIRFNKTLLLPADATDTTLPAVTDGNYQEIEFTFTADEHSSRELAFTAALGNSECTDIEFDVFAFSSECEKIKINAENGKFCLDGICKEAGSRLYKQTQRLNLMQNMPNPFSEASTVRFTLIEKGVHRLYVNDILGKKVLRVFEKQFSAGHYEAQINASSLPAGTYFLMLETPSAVFSSRIEIIK